MTDNKEILKMNSVDLLNWMGTDAQKWTQAFLVHTDLANAGPDFMDTVRGWFANAIGFGETSGMNKAMEEIHHAAKNLGLDLTEVYTPAYALEVAWASAHPGIIDVKHLENIMDDLNQVGWDGSLPIRDHNGVIWLVYGEERSEGGEACTWWLIGGDPEDHMKEVDTSGPLHASSEKIYEPTPLSQATYPVTLLYRPREVE